MKRKEIECTIEYYDQLLSDSMLSDEMKIIYCSKRDELVKQKIDLLESEKNKIISGFINYIEKILKIEL